MQYSSLLFIIWRLSRLSVVAGGVAGGVVNGLAGNGHGPCAGSDEPACSPPATLLTIFSPPGQPAPLHHGWGYNGCVKHAARQIPPHLVSSEFMLLET